MIEYTDTTFEKVPEQDAVWIHEEGHKIKLTYKMIDILNEFVAKYKAEGVIHESKY